MTTWDTQLRSLDALVELVRAVTDDAPSRRHAYTEDGRFAKVPTLFDQQAGSAPPITVNGLPYVSGSATSHQAARKARLSAPNQRERVLAYIRLYGPCSDEQIAKGCEMNPSTERPRRGELAKGGSIRRYGYAKTTAGRSAVTWVAL